MPQFKFNVRTSELITTYGPGSMVPMGDMGSAMVAALDHWHDVNSDANLVEDERLANLLGIQKFVLPPTSEQKQVPIVRFPTMVSCPGCHILQRYNKFGNQGPAGNECNECGKTLVPSRFVVVCRNGHIDNFPYKAWVHAKHMINAQECGGTLKITSNSTSASLSSINVTCASDRQGCGAERSMQEAFTPSILRDIGGCRGQKPWIGRSEYEACDARPVVLQRGDASIWIPVHKSSLTIPPWSQPLMKGLNPELRKAYQKMMKGDVSTEIFHTLAKMFLENHKPIVDGQIGMEEFINFYKEAMASADATNIGDPNNDLEFEHKLRSDEYKAITEGTPAGSSEDMFLSEGPVELGQYSVSKLETMMRLPLLTETRVLRAFTRAASEKVDNQEITPTQNRLSQEPLDWLPAVKIKGEGIFITLNENRLNHWESKPEIIEQVHKLKKVDDDPFNLHFEITPRFILLHTIAHSLIQQFTVECGYPLSSLRERIYSGSEMNGVLIYTNGGDSAGSLGGLVAQSEKTKFDQTFRKALNSQQWCSNDPLCIESPSGIDSVNWGCCQACILLPEPSCEVFNSYLDRRMLIPEYDGYFVTI